MGKIVNSHKNSGEKLKKFYKLSLKCKTPFFVTDTSRQDTRQNISSQQFWKNLLSVFRDWKSHSQGSRELSRENLVGKIDVRSGKKNGSTSLENDNMCYVSFRIREQECVPWCGEIQNQRSKVLGKTFNLHFNSTWCPRCVVS